MYLVRFIFLAGVMGVLLPGQAVADLYVSNYSEPDYDRWNYMFNGSPGDRIVASTFSAYGSGYDFDDRDGQLLLGWVTVDIPTDLPASSYRVLSMTVDIAIASDDIVGTTPPWMIVPRMNQTVPMTQIPDGQFVCPVLVFVAAMTQKPTVKLACIPLGQFADSGMHTPWASPQRVKQSTSRTT